MSKTKAMWMLKASLIESISNWIESEASKDDAWHEIGYSGTDLAIHMALAAMACLEASVDVQKTIKENE